MTKHPDWATRQRRKGTELRLINGNYYLYEVSSVWDKEKKRSKKVTGKLLGKITEQDGFIESDKARLRNKQLIVTKLVVKEYGITELIHTIFQDYKILLEKHFPNEWQAIICLVYARLAFQSPLKNIEHHYHYSYLSDQYPGLALSGKSLTSLMRQIGFQREKITSFFKEFTKANDNILFDGTDLLSNSKKMDVTKLSKSKKGSFDSLANLMFVFSVGLQLPIYYRIIPGNIKDIKAFKLCLDESQIKDAVIIADKGFFSAQNVNQLKEGQLRFIIPLRRNNAAIQYDILIEGNKKNFEGHFIFEERVIWYYSYVNEDNHFKVYLDEELKSEEIKDFLRRAKTLPEKYDLDSFYKKQHTFGSITLMHNEQKTAEELYLNYKARGKVENMIDVFKNIIDADRSYMQNEQALEGWMFIHYIALHWYYKIFHLLVEHKLNHKYAPLDLLMLLKEIRKVKINDKWHTAEITAKTKKLLDNLNIHIT